MAMSTDRVEFLLRYDRLKGVPDKDELLKTTLGLSDAEIKQIAKMGNAGDAVTIRCRPSQFARFLIRRDEMGGVNGFKELCAKLIEEVPPPSLIDVAKRNRCEYEVAE